MAKKKNPAAKKFKSRKEKLKKKIRKVSFVKKKVRKPVPKKKQNKKREKKNSSPLRVATKKRPVILKKQKKTFAKKINSKRAHKKEENQEVIDSSPKSFFKAKIRVIGIGGGGGSIVSEIGRSLHKASFVVADTDSRSFFRKKAGIKYLLFGQELTRGLGTGLNTELARNAALAEKEKIEKLFDGQDIVIFIACLGGGLGSGATQVFAQALQKFGGIGLGIFTLPFKFEGKAKQKIAAKALSELRALLNVSITIPNERIFRVIDENTAITEAFSLVNKSLVESLESLIDLIYSPGVINIDFADLQAILQGKGNFAFLNTVEAAGKDRMEKIVKGILDNPLYQSNNFIPEKILFNIAGGGNLNMFEIDRISRVISEKNPKAKIIFGISKNSDHKNRVKTTLLMTGPSTLIEKPEVVPDSGEKIVNKQKEKPLKPKKGKVPRKQTNATGSPMSAFHKQPISSTVALVDSDAEIVAPQTLSVKKAIRRSALEIKEAQELEELKKSEQEKEWEVPAFLRKIKIKR